MARHRRVLATRPELRQVYESWFRRMLNEVTRGPIVEVGAGPGHFKTFAPDVIATDIVIGARIDLCCDAGALPFRSGSLGAIVAVDAIHCFSRPLAFFEEAARVLRPGGRVVLLDTWISPLSYLLYRYVHHADCRFDVELAAPFGRDGKPAMRGNAAISTLIVRMARAHALPVRLLRVETFPALPYLVTLGFKFTRRVPAAVVKAARVAERVFSPLRKLCATRAFIVFERPEAAG